LDQQEILKPEFAFIDAPLSLPRAYFPKASFNDKSNNQSSETKEDYHFRKCDRELNAMSPMFLGGLTARAISLKSRIAIPLYETYPGYFARNILSIQKKMKTIEPNQLELLLSILPYPLADKPKNTHQFDAILAWHSGWRWKQGQALEFGDLDEGIILL